MTGFSHKGLIVTMATFVVLEKDINVESKVMILQSNYAQKKLKANIRDNKENS